MMLKQTLKNGNSNLHLGKLLAVGNTAEIYAWEPGWILKLFFERYEKGMALFEKNIAERVYATGLPVPAVGEVIEVNGREGLLYQEIEGEQMGKYLGTHPWNMASMAITLAKLHTRMHEKPFRANLPLLHQRMEQKIRDAKPLPENVRATAIKALESMPVGDRLCHGDFHPGNILLGQAEPIIIDWIDVSIGNPLADVARTSLIARGWVETAPHFSPIQRFGLRIFHRVYLRQYFHLRPGGWEEYQRWLPIVAAARLSEGVEGWESWLLEQAERLLLTGETWMRL